MKREYRDRREDVLDFIATFHEDHGYAPSVREIGRGVGLTSTNSTWYYLQKLAREKRLRYDANVARSIVLTP